VSSPLRDLPAQSDDGGPTEREPATVISQLERMGARLVAVGHGRDERSRRAGQRFSAAWHGGRDWEGADRELAITVDWPSEAASWLKPARRLGDPAVDAWVVADTAQGLAKMSARLRDTAEWSPRRTVAFAGLDLAPTPSVIKQGTLDGLVGASFDGGLWFVEGGGLVRHSPKKPRSTMDSLFNRQPVEIAPGAVHVPGWLSVAQQQKLVLDCRRWGEGPAPMRHTKLPNGGTMSVQTVCLGWHWTPYRYTRTAVDQDGAPVAEFPSWLADLGRTALADAYGENELAAAYDPDAALINFYDPEAKLGMHQDKDERSTAPVVSLSIGDSCRFRFGNPESRGRPYTDVELQSGDLFVFGGPSRLAFHGVTKVLPGTADPAVGLTSGRLNLTLRETGLTD
jgi:alkylated DNA repair protein (DNA oxidative demethylase)